MSDRELLQQALEALEHGGPAHRLHAIHNLRAALAEPEQEPVAWMVYTQDGKSAYVTDNPADIGKGQQALALFTAPPARRPLTDEMVKRMKENCSTMEMRGAFADGWLSAEAAIERKITGAKDD